MANELVARIRKIKTAIASLQAELDEAKRELLADEMSPQQRGDRSAVTSTPKRTQQPASKTAMPKRRRMKAPGSTRGIPETSSIGRAITILKEHGGEWTVEEMLRRIEEKFHERVKKDTLVGNLSRYQKAKKIFYRAAPNTYGLLEWRHKHAKAS